MPDRVDEVRLVKILLDIPLFEDLDYTQITAIIEKGDQREVQPGEVLCESRTIDESLFVFLNGKLRLESAEGGKLAELDTVRVLGEMGVFTGQIRSSRVVGDQASTVFELNADDLQELLEEDPQMGNHMLVSLIKLLYTRVHDVNDEVAVLHNQADRLQSRLREVAPEDPLLAELFPEDLPETEL